MWDISKEFEFDYGHRVWTQQPDKDLSCNHKCVCRHLHGHRGKVVVHLVATKLNEQGMVTDFVNLNWFKKFLDDALDHKMILDMSDPMLTTFFPKLAKIKSWVPAIGNIFKDKYFDFQYGYATLKPENYLDLNENRECDQEIYEGLVFVPFVPTSENLARWLSDVVKEKMATLDIVNYIEFYETPKSKSIYHGH